MCNTYTIQSAPSLTDLQLDTSTLEVSNCSGSITTIDSPDDTIIVTPEFLNQTEDVICDGIYCFTFTYVYTDGTIEQNTIQLFVDCVVKCAIVESLLKDPSNITPKLYEAIKYASECSECDCEKACQLYENLLEELDNIEDNDNTDKSKCC